MTDQIKLNFDFDNALDCEVAHHNGYRIKAVRDEHPENPFTAWDCNWPISVRSPDGYYSSRITDYEERFPGPSIREPLAFFNDAQLVHWQVHIAKLLETTVEQLTIDDSWDEPKGYLTEASVLRQLLCAAWGEVEESKLFDLCVDLFKLIDIPAFTTQVTGYCQGDWAEVLVVAAPAAQAEFGNTDVKADDLAATADLYEAWAFGDVYGYVIEQPAEVDEDGDVIEWEEIDGHSSCWGYYGPDHDKSGLAEAALECVPDEPAPTPVFEGELEDA